MIRRHATSASALVAAMADRPGVKHLRTTRGAYPVLYPDDEQFPIGGSKVLKRQVKTRSPSSEPASPCATASLPRRRSARRASGRGSSACTSSSPSTPPPSPPRLARPAGSSWSRTTTPIPGSARLSLRGLAERGVSGAAVAHLAVGDMPGSGTTTELLAAAGLAAPGIAAAARTLISGGA